MTEGGTEIWYERVYGRIGLSLWQGALVFGAGVTLALFPVGYGLSGLWEEILASGILLGVPFMLAILALIHLVGAFIRSGMLRWKEQADPLLAEGPKLDLRELFALKGVGVTYILMLVFIQAIYVLTVLPEKYSVTQKLVLSLPFDYWEAYLATIIWMFSFSMYKVYATGRRPMKLKDFADDRSLGLRPFGRISLQLTGVYLALLTLAFLVVVANGTATLTMETFLLGLVLLGLGFFIAPQIGLHGKMVVAKAEALEWVSPQYAGLVKDMRVRGLMETDDRVMSRLTAIESVKKDVSQIHVWPFDVGILARLGAIILSVVAILLSAIVRNFLHI